MLKMIDEVLNNIVRSVNIVSNHVSIYVKKLLDVMEVGVNYTALELMDLLNMKSRDSFRKNYLSPALDNGLIKMTFPDKLTSKNQTYYKD